MKLERLLAIVMLLMNRDRVTARELSEIFEVSGRTIQRDMEAINLAGIPVVSYQGSRGGYGIIKEYKIEKGFMSNTEYQMLLTALRGVYQAYEDKNLQNMINKLMVIKQPKADIGQKVVFDFSSWGETARKKEKIALVKKGIEENRMVSFNYVNWSGDATRRSVEPYTLLLKVNNWYLYGYCQMREAYRIFKLSRVTNLELTGDHFLPRSEIPPLSLKDKDERPLTKLVLKFHPKALNRLEAYFDLEELTYDQRGMIHVTVHYPEDEWVYGMLLSFGELVEVLEPQHIKAILMERAEKMIKKYQK